MSYSNIFTLFFGLLFGGSLFAQYHRSIEVKAGEDVAKAYSPNGFYRFPAFSKGALFSRIRKGESSQLFNYDLLYDKIQFINHGDTMEMANPTLFDSVIIDNHIFYYKQDLGFLELIATNDPLKLVRKTIIKLKPQTIGAYDGATTTSAINKINTYTTGYNVYTFTVNEDLQIKEDVDWFWIDEKGRPTKATQKNLLYILPPDKQQSAGRYIKLNKINFNKEEDLINLVKALQ